MKSFSSSEIIVSDRLMKEMSKGNTTNSPANPSLYLSRDRFVQKEGYLRSKNDSSKVHTSMYSLSLIQKEGFP